MKRQSTVLQVSPCSTNPASCLASLQDGREIPVVEKHGWKHYNMAALLAPPAESLMHWYISFTKMLRSGKPAFRNLQGTALQISAHHVISRRNPLAQRAEEVSAGGESSLNCSKAHQIKATSWSNDSPHPEFRHAFSTTPPKELESARPHETILPWLPSLARPSGPIPCLRTCAWHSKSIQGCKWKLTFQNKIWRGKEIVFSVKKIFFSGYQL